MKCAVIVVAAGRGSRFGGDVPKQYLDLDGRPMLRHCLARFAAHPAVSAVRAVIRPGDNELYAAAAAGLNLLAPVHGGTERQDSVRLGLESLEGQGFDVVLIHDGARPFVSHAVVDDVLGALADHPGAIPGLPVSDSLKSVKDGVVSQTVPREGLWRVQTPQGFRFDAILQAHRDAAGLTLTDDAAVLEKVGGKVALVPGDAANIKVTTATDLTDRSAAAIMETRIGTGYDVHAFTEGRFVTLCGVSVPHDRALLGHSDADVAMHALTDALYGAIAAGDIGRHFPPSDPRWKGAPSSTFLDHARTLVEALGGRIVNVDLTIICEAPKVGPHRNAMTGALASILRIPSDRISVKATTTEGLGFTGRAEGIAAQATATVALPANH